ncbi:glycosyltransferase family 39 protein [Flavobacterium lacisediminis]|uniref:glycosyltransferase family 39 protein n=1 Tax=Flavobacterium lacisediminis TaxID=2989705 RepID=UPI00221F530D|nr:glycosyltransferase family 39 protein [Flavobacterium lacisediminis]
MKKIINQLLNNKWIISILFVAIFLRLYKIDYQSLWMDEIYTMNISNPENSFSTVIDEVNNRDGFPYLYFILLKIFHALFGFNSIIARLFSVFGGIISIYLIYILTKKIINKNTALIVSLLFCLSHYHIYISQEARPYSLYLAVTIFVYYRLWCFLNDKSLKNAVFYGLSAGLLLNINFFGFINLFSQFIFILFYFYQTKQKISKDILKQFFIIGIITILIFLPNIQKFILLFGKGEFWVPKPTQDSFTIMIKEVFGNSEFLLFLYLVVFQFLLFNLFKLKGNVSNNNKLLAFTFLLFWGVVFVLFLLVKSYGEVSLILTRYFTSVIPVIYIFIAWGINEIKNKFLKHLAIVLIIIFSLINLVLEKKYYDSPNKAQFREASNTVIENNSRKHEVYTSQKYWFDYYFNKSEQNPVVEKEFETLINEMINDSSKIQSFWYLDAFGKVYQPSDKSLEFINKNFVIDESFDGFQGWAKHFVLTKETPQFINLSGLDIKSTYSGDSFMNNIEIFDIKDNLLSVSGWAYFNNISSEETKLYLVLINNNTQIDRVKLIPIQSINRPDVTSYFKCDFNADNSGFKADFEISNLNNEEYKVGIYLENKKLAKKGLFVSDKIIK